MAATQKREYHLSPFGIAIHPWLNNPDTKFNAEGVYKTGLRVPVAEAAPMMARIQTAAERYLAEVTEGMTPAERKKWSLYLPFEEEEDDEGNKTGFVVFNFKQNATLTLKSGEKKEIKLQLQDGLGKDNPRPIMGGSKLRTKYALRDVKMTSGKQAGVRLDFAGVQVVVYNQGSQGGGFGAVEGYVDDGYVPDEMPAVSSKGDQSAADGDY
mgnify:CR=1 FL=1|jgi:hypothetical protein